MWLDDVKALRQSFTFQDKDWLDTEQLKKDINTHSAQNRGAGISLDLFNRIASWKLGDKKLDVSGPRSRTISFAR